MMKKSIFIMIIGVIVAALVFSIFQKHDYIIIGDKEYYFGMTKYELEHVLGKPTEEFAYNDGDDEHIYNLRVDKYDAISSFLFYRSKLYDITIKIPNIDYDTALSIANCCFDKHKETYLDRDGYYSLEPEIIEGESFLLSNGVNNGATGIDFEYVYSLEKLTITAIKQE